MSKYIPLKESFSASSTPSPSPGPSPGPSGATTQSDKEKILNLERRLRNSQIQISALNNQVITLTTNNAALQSASSASSGSSASSASSSSSSSQSCDYTNYITLDNHNIKVSESK